MNECATVAEIWPVPPPFGGTVLTRRNKLWGNLIEMWPAAFAIGAFALICVGILVFDFPRTTEALVCIGVGLLIQVSGIYLGLGHANLLGNRYLYYLTRRRVSRRPDRLVEPDDPEAVFVEVVPRKNWTRAMLNTATDLGFLRIDEESREIRLEGAKDRYRIPATAVLDSRIELGRMFPGIPRLADVFVIVIQVRCPAGLREVPLAYCGSSGFSSLRQRQLQAIELENRILRLFPRKRSPRNEEGTHVTS